MQPINVKGRRLAATNSKWKVFLDHISDGRGNEVADYLVIEPLETMAENVTGVSVLPVLDGRIALLLAYRHALGTHFWEVPRGFVDVGETAVQAALRELAEETGLTCAPEDLVPLGRYAPEASTIAGRGALFAATRCIGTLRPPTDELGLGTLKLFEAEEVERLALSGGIEDAGTLIAYFRYRLTR